MHNAQFHAHEAKCPHIVHNTLIEAKPLPCIARPERRKSLNGSFAPHPPTISHFIVAVTILPIGASYGYDGLSSHLHTALGRLRAAWN